MTQPIKARERVIGTLSKPIVSSPTTPTRLRALSASKGSIIKSPDPIHGKSGVSSEGSENEGSLTTPDIISSDVTPVRSSTISPSNSVIKIDDLKIQADSDANLTCPICNEKMISLLQLNRHIDDEHLATDHITPTKQLNSSPTRSDSTTPTFLSFQSPNDDFKSWLQKGNDVKAKIQTAIPRKFVKLDIFDNNTTFSITDSSSRDSSSTSLNNLGNEIIVTRKHWKKPNGHDICSAHGCRKHLSIKNGIVNCRKCGRLFCHDHSKFRIRLDANAHYDHSGAWCRSCQTCYEKTPGYNDLGLFRDLTLHFENKRRNKINERQLYENKLETRLSNLSNSFNKINKEFHSNELNSNFLNFRINSRKKDAEHQIVQWENEKGVLNCFICLNHFSFTLRKHHCRLCGRVVCGNVETGCSMEIEIDKLTELLEDLPRSYDKTPIRLCRHCKDVLFLKRNFVKDVKKELSPMLSKFERHQNLKKAILLLMPKFKDLIVSLQNDNNLQNKKLVDDASKIRSKLVESFSMFDSLTKEITNLDCSIEDEKRLQLSIQNESAIFIQQNMAPLKQLQKILKKIDNESKKNKLPKLSFEEVQQIKENRETLMVLNEQKFLVDQMIENCKKQRKYDEIEPLSENLRDITQQIEYLQLKLGNEGF